MAQLLIFDVNGTLSDFTPAAEALGTMGAPRGLVSTWLAATLRDGFAASLATVGRAFPDVAEQTLTGLLSSESDLTCSVGEGVSRVMEVLMELPTHPDVPDGVRALAAAGHRMVTLSNGSAGYAHDLLERAGVADLFEAFLSVEDVGVWKPDPRTYEYALTYVAAEASDAVMIAAHPWDLHGAHACGMTTVHLDRDHSPWPTIFRAPDLRVGSLAGLHLT